MSSIYLHLGQGLSVLETFWLDRDTLDSPVVGFIRIQNIEDVGFAIKAIFTLQVEQMFLPWARALKCNDSARGMNFGSLLES